MNLSFVMHEEEGRQNIIGDGLAPRETASQVEERAHQEGNQEGEEEEGREACCQKCSCSCIATPRPTDHSSMEIRVHGFELPKGVHKQLCTRHRVSNAAAFNLREGQWYYEEGGQPLGRTEDLEHLRVQGALSLHV